MRDPEFIMEHCNELGYNECFALLKEWIVHSNNQIKRQKALKFLSEIENGTHYEFFEALFLSDENINIVLQCGAILRKYSNHINSFIKLLQYALSYRGSVQRKLFAVEILNTIRKAKAFHILVAFLNPSMKKAGLNSNNLNYLHTYATFDKYNAWFSPEYIEKAINRLLYEYYSKECGYKVNLEHGLITSLTCEGKQLRNIHDIEEFHRLRNIKQLILKDNNFSEISGLNHLKNLQYLNLSHNQIKKIHNLKDLRKLCELDLSNNSIETIENLDSLVNLKKLSLACNSIRNINNLYKLTELKKLDLSHNFIKNITGLHKLRKLITLILSYNHIKKIEGVELLKNLQELYLNNNEITHIEGIDSLTHLIILFLANNNIHEFHCQDIHSLNNLHFISLHHNPLNTPSREYYHKQIRAF